MGMRNSAVGLMVYEQTILQAYTDLLRERKTGSSPLKRFGMRAFRDRG